MGGDGKEATKKNPILLFGVMPLVRVGEYVFCGCVGALWGNTIICGQAAFAVLWNTQMKLRRQLEVIHSSESFFLDRDMGDIG